MYNQFHQSKGIQLEPPISFGNNCQYNTRTPSYFANIVRCRLTFAQKFFRFKATQQWNSLPAFVTRTICNGHSGASWSALQQHFMDSAIG